MQRGKNWILPKQRNANRFFQDSHWLEIWSNLLFSSMGPNGGIVTMDTVHVVAPLEKDGRQGYEGRNLPPTITRPLCYTWFQFQYLMTTSALVSFSHFSSQLAGPPACASSKSALVHVLRKEKRGENSKLDPCGIVTRFLQLVSVSLFNDDLCIGLFISISSWLAGPTACASSKSALVHVLRKEKRV